MENSLGIVRCVLSYKSCSLFFGLVVISSCLDEIRSYSEAGPGGRLTREVECISCYLMIMRVARGPGVEELCMRFLRCSGDSACMSLRK